MTESIQPEKQKRRHLKKLTLLHSNDMHGDFLAEDEGGKLVGGVSRLSGYINKVRKEEKNVLYAIAGDMFRGSVIDSEYKGLSTIEIMNMLAPSVATLGNHEVDYGVSHMLFVEKCARFPIVNANIYIVNNHIRLFRSHIILNVGGIKVLFIGILTEDVLAQARQEKLVGSFVDVYEAADEVGKICNSFRTEDIDLTVLLTHIGFEEDKKLASILDPAWGVDLIIGGHSHTKISEPAVVNGIPIAQAACGTDQVGRFDLVIDMDTNSIASYEWNLIPIDDKHCPRDEALEEVIQKYKKITDLKYDRYITRFSRQYVHPRRDRETELGRLFADIFKEALGVDIMFLASGSIREEKLGPIVQYRDITQCFPYNDEIYRITVNGAQLKKMIEYVYRPEVFDGVHTEFYQFSRGLKIIVSEKERKVKEITFKGKSLDENTKFRIGLQNYHYINLEDFFGIKKEEIEKNEKAKVISTTSLDILEEWLSGKELVTAPEDKRIIFEGE